MTTIAINTSKLPIADKLGKGQNIITKSTNNPDAPGNAAALAIFSSAQTTLDAANASYEEVRQEAKQLMAARDDAETAWTVAITGFAGVTESVTGGDATKFLSTGFDVKPEATPPQPVEQVQNVKVSYTGMPGYAEVRWKRERSSDAYVVQCSPEPITETSGKNMGTVTEPKYTGNGATPGQKCWYRVAGVNRLGQGAWSEPALRPVM